MLFLKESCRYCHKPMNGGVYRAPHICPHCLSDNREEVASPSTPPSDVQWQDPAETYMEPAVPIESQASAPIDTPEASEPQQPVEPAEDTSQPEYRAQSGGDEQVTTTEQTEESYAQQYAEPSVEHPTTQGLEAADVTLTTQPPAGQNIVADLGQVAADGEVIVELTPDLFNAKGKFIGVKSEPVLAALKQGKKSALSHLRDNAAITGANFVANVAIKNGMKLINAQSAKVTVAASGDAYVIETNSEFTDI